MTKPAAVPSVVSPGWPPPAPSPTHGPCASDVVGVWQGPGEVAWWACEVTCSEVHGAGLVLLTFRNVDIRGEHRVVGQLALDRRCCQALGAGLLVRVPNGRVVKGETAECDLLELSLAAAV